jgi:hypothetical protein
MGFDKHQDDQRVAHRPKCGSCAAVLVSGSLPVRLFNLSIFIKEGFIFALWAIIRIFGWTGQPSYLDVSRQIKILAPARLKWSIKYDCLLWCLLR